jgi:hypothetical protein
VVQQQAACFFRAQRISMPVLTSKCRVDNLQSMGSIGNSYAGFIYLSNAAPYTALEIDKTPYMRHDNPTLL